MMPKTQIDHRERVNDHIDIQNVHRETQNHCKEIRICGGWGGRMVYIYPGPLSHNLRTSAGRCLEAVRSSKQQFFISAVEY